MERKHVLIAVAVVAIAVIAGAAAFLMANGPQEPDSIIIGNIVTMDDENPIAEAVVVKDGMIVFVGSEEDARKMCGADTKEYDYTGYTVYPGFLESHMHVNLAGLREFGMAKLSIGVPLAETVKEIEKYIKENPGKEFYIGMGWLVGTDEPNAAMLDAVCLDVPVMLLTSDGHASWVNSKCLEILDFSPEYIREMGPQQIHVDANGKPTGFLQETPSINILQNLPFTVEDLKGFVLKWQDMMFASGYTAVCDAGVELCGDKIYQAISELDREGLLKIDIIALPLVRDNTDTPEADIAHVDELAKKYNSKHFRIAGVKVFIDGVTEGRTAWMLEPYKDNPESTGIPRFSDVDKLAALITVANEHGYPVHCHAVGDAAVHAFATAVEKSVKETGNYDQRNAAAHLQFITEEDKDLFAEYGIIAVDGYSWAVITPNTPSDIEAVGLEKFMTAYPAQSLIEKGITVVGHSDYPVSPLMNVPLMVYSAVARTLPFMHEIIDPLGENEKMGTWDALKSLTSDVAYSWFEEDYRGTLEAGKVANMTVLDVDFMNDDLYDIANAMQYDAVATIIDGEVVFEGEPVEMTDEEFMELMNLIVNLLMYWAINEM